MKLKSLAFCTLALIATTAMYAQKLPINIGVQAGVNLGNVHGLSLKGTTKAGYVVGAYVDLNVAKKIAIEPALIFNATGGTTSTTSTSSIPNLKFNLHYLSIPILIDYKIIPFVHIKVGPQFSTLLNSKESIVSNGIKSFKSGNFSIIAGAEARLLKFRVGIQYIGGLTNINNLDNNDSYKISGARIIVGYNFL